MESSWISKLTMNTQSTYLVFFAIFELGSAICGAAQSSSMLIIGRAIAGVGAAGVSSGAYTILSATVPFEKRPGKCYVLEDKFKANRSQIAMLGMLMGSESSRVHATATWSNTHDSSRPARYNQWTSCWRWLYNGLYLAMV